MSGRRVGTDGIVGIAATAACMALLGILVLVPGASAQTTTPAQTQYSPTLDAAGVIASGELPDDPAGANAGEVAGEAGGVAGEAGGGGAGGKLPFTGYPLTPIVALILLLITAGLALRMIAPRLDRRRA